MTTSQINLLKNSIVLKIVALSQFIKEECPSREYIRLEHSSFNGHSTTSYLSITDKGCDKQYKTPY